MRVDQQGQALALNGEIESWCTGRHRPCIVTQTWAALRSGTRGQTSVTPRLQGSTRIAPKPTVNPLETDGRRQSEAHSRIGIVHRRYLSLRPGKVKERCSLGGRHCPLRRFPPRPMVEPHLPPRPRLAHLVPLPWKVKRRQTMRNDSRGRIWDLTRRCSRVQGSHWFCA